MALHETLRDHQNGLIVIELFYSESKWWADRQTDVAILRTTPLAWLKIADYVTELTHM